MLSYSYALVLFGRGLRLRCPVCGQGKIFSGFFKTYEYCPVCHFAYEREPGYYTGAIAMNLVLSELLIAAIAIPLAASHAVPLIPLMAGGLIMPFLFPILFYRHTKSIWMSIDHMVHPVGSDEV